MRRFEGQGAHILVVSFLLLPVVWYARLPVSLRGEWLTIPTRVWFWVAIVTPVVHQLGIMILWRIELHDRGLTRVFGAQAFSVHQAFFFPGLLARPISVLALAISDQDRLGEIAWILFIIALCMLPPLIYLFYSILRYFGIQRAAGSDHFIKEVQGRPLVREGIFGIIPNAMYVVGFFIVWLPGLVLASRGALVAAGFQHVLIWAHYNFTEKPDMRMIYGEQ